MTERGAFNVDTLPTVFQSVITGFWSVGTGSEPLATGFASVRSVYQSVIFGFWSVTIDS